MNCPLGIDLLSCQDCPYAKEGLCDYPYHQDLTDQEISERSMEILAG